MPKRAATVPATGIVLDRAGRLPIHRQLSQRLREAILAGQFPPGTRLPSTRERIDIRGVAEVGSEHDHAGTHEPAGVMQVAHPMPQELVHEQIRHAALCRYGRAR